MSLGLQMNWIAKQNTEIQVWMILFLLYCMKDDFSGWDFQGQQGTYRTDVLETMQIYSNFAWSRAVLHLIKTDRRDEEKYITLLTEAQKKNV